MTVTFGVANFLTGGSIVELPVNEGASWAVALNKPDSLSCELDLRDEDILALEPLSTTEPKKTVLFAMTDTGDVLAAGLVSDRSWSDDGSTMTVNASGFWQYFNERIIAPATARTAALTTKAGVANPALDTTITNRTLGSIGVRLVSQALAWPGATMPFDLPAEVAEERDGRTYRFIDLKSVGSALTDLVGVEGGPDFAFDARRVDGADGISLVYPMRVGAPYLGSDVGSWALGGSEPVITGLTVDDDGADIATAQWMTGGKSDSAVIASRLLNDTLRTRGGYPPLDFVDTSRNDVTRQATLDAYNVENRFVTSRLYRSLAFNVRGDATPPLGQYRPGDWVTLDVADNLYLPDGPIVCRIMGFSGDETGELVKVDVVLESQTVVDS